ncbi:polysaccharide deacetylase family protein [Halalkalicoccus jeotgali]|nr:polysaccharide deacetylase family protein [Halalkalicoccus jeotgali]
MSNTDQSEERDSNGTTRRSFLGGIGVSSGTLLFGTQSNVGLFSDLKSKRNRDTQILKRPSDSRTRWQYAGWMKDSFENLSEWDVVAGSMTADTSTSHVGDQAAKLSTSGKEVRIETSISSTNFSNYDVSIAAKLKESNADIEVRLCDSHGEYVVYRSPLRANDGWLQSNMGVSSETSDVDITDIQTIQVQFIAENEGIEGWVDNLRYHPKPDGAQCVLTFDDSTISHYEKAYPIMQEFGFSGFASLPTYYHENDAQLDMMSGVAETDQDPMTVDQMRELQRQGWEFGSEMKTHSQTADLSEEEVREEVRDSKQWLVENEFIGNVPAITYPYGSHDETVLDITAGYYGMGRIVDDTLNRATLTNPLHISGHSVYSDNISRTKELIDLAVKHNQTAVLNFHGLDEYGWQPGGEMSSSDFREVLEYLYNKGPSSIPTVSYSNWWNNLDQLHSNV